MGIFWLGKARAHPSIFNSNPLKKKKREERQGRNNFSTSFQSTFSLRPLQDSDFEHIREPPRKQSFNKATEN